MGSVPPRARRLESAVSICLLTILFLIAIGVFIKQSPKAVQQGQADLASLILAGFQTPSKTQIYNAANLYEKIDGKAPFYTESGFQKLSTRRFTSQKDNSLSMELYLYDMSAVRNAFSVYSVQKRPDAEVLPALQFAYRTGNALYFACGKYYIELIGSSESSELSEAMMLLSQKLKRKLAVGETTDIAELDLFPTQHFVRDSNKLYLADAFGFEGLSDTFTARYQIQGETITAFLSVRPGRDDAKKVTDSYYNFLINSGGVAKPAANKILEGKVIDFYDTTEIIFAIGPFVAGIHEAENQLSAEKLAQMLIDKLSEVAKAKGND